MKRIVTMFFMAMVIFAPVAAFAEGGHANDTVFEKTADWFAVIGKSPEERDGILFERRAERAAKKLQAGINRSARKVSKDMDKIGKDLEKAFK